MRYYFKVYTKGIFPKCVYTSELYDTESEAEKAAENCNDADHCAFVETYHPLQRATFCGELAIIGDWE